MVSPKVVQQVCMRYTYMLQGAYAPRTRLEERFEPRFLLGFFQGRRNRERRNGLRRRSSESVLARQIAKRSLEVLGTRRDGLGLSGRDTSIGKRDNDDWSGTSGRTLGYKNFGILSLRRRGDVVGDRADGRDRRVTCGAHL